MPKLMRTLVLGAMLAVTSTTTAVAREDQPVARDQAVQQFRAGERAPLGQPVSRDEAVQRFRAGERASQAQAAAPDQAMQRFRAGERSSPGQPAPVAAAAPADRPGTPVGLLAALAAAAVLALSLDALFERRKARKTAARVAI
jgi:hypothetical protein